MSSINLEGLEMKEATPSIAPSNYETQYTKKWRILVAVAIGISLIGASMLIFYLSTRSIQPSDELQAGFATIDGLKLSDDKDLSLWRSVTDGRCLSSRQEKCSADYKIKPLLVLALGGLSNNQTYEIPALRELIRCGTAARSLVSSYPSYSYPNLYTIATGLYPASHGIVSNKMYDPVINLNFTIDSPVALDPVWWKGEPIWNTLSKQGRRTATYLWPGSNVNIQESLPTYNEKDKLLYRTRMLKILKWLKLPEEERPHLIMMYYDEPEETAQKLGPFPTSVKAVLNRINDGIDELMNSLWKEKLVNCVDVLVVSDHGMSPMNCHEAIDIDDIDDYRKERYPIRMFAGSVSTMAFLKSADDKTRQQIVERLRCKNANLRVLEKLQVPLRYHYTNNRRIGDLILDSAVGYRVYQNEDKDCSGFHGTSGYNNLEDSMQGVFAAHGPSFKEGFKLESFRNIEIYNLICSVLNVSPSPNNGTYGSLDSMLNEVGEAVQKNAPKILFLEEVMKPRYKRPNDGLLEPKSDLEKCNCDRSHWQIPTEQSTLEETTTTPSTTTSTTTATSSTLSSSTTTTTTTTTAAAAITTATTATTTVSSTTSTETSTTPSPSESSSTAIETSSESNPSTSPSITKEITTLDKIPTVATSIPNLEGAAGKVKDEYSTADEILTRKKREVEDDEETLSELRDRHCPMGCPRFSAPEVSSDVVNILHQSHYIIGLPESLNMGIWVSFTLTKNYLQELAKLRPSLPKDVIIKPEDVKRETTNGCWIADPRSSRSSTDQCGRRLQTDLHKSKNVTWMQLYPEEFEEPSLLATEGFYLSNMAPKLWGYIEGGRKVMLKAIDKLVLKYNIVNVQHGPIFDFDLDGKKDNITEIRNTQKPLIPSKYFFVVTFCNSTSDTENSEESYISQCPNKDKVVLSFAFPNVNKRDMCKMTEDSYLKYHISNMVDIEEVSGIRFFQKLSKRDHAQLRSRQPVHIGEFVSL